MTTKSGGGNKDQFDWVSSIPSILEIMVKGLRTLRTERIWQTTAERDELISYVYTHISPSTRPSRRRCVLRTRVFTGIVFWNLRIYWQRVKVTWRIQRLKVASLESCVWQRRIMVNPSVGLHSFSSLCFREIRLIRRTFRRRCRCSNDDHAELAVYWTLVGTDGRVDYCLFERIR